MPYYDFTQGIDNNFLNFHKDAMKNKGFNAFIVADWCGHCQAMSSEREKVEARAKKLKGGKPVVSFSADVAQHLQKEHSNNRYAQVLNSAVNGYPSIVNVSFKSKNNVEVELFEGNRVAKEISSFFNN